MNRFEWAEALTISQAIELSTPGSAIKAGGVDLLDLMKERIAQPRRLVNIQHIPNLDFIRLDDDGSLTVGPLVTLATLAEDSRVNEHFMTLGESALSAATPQIRNMATIAGNLLQRPRCWYFRNEQFPCRKKGGEQCFAIDGENQYHAIFDNSVCAIVHPSSTAAALVALGAILELTGSHGARQLSLEQFFTSPATNILRENALRERELITAIRVPPWSKQTGSVYLKQGEKDSFDWPIAEVATVIERDGDRCARASIVLGAAAPVPRRAVEAETILKGQSLDQQLVRVAADAALSRATPLSQNAYKVSLFKSLIARAVLAAWDRAGGAS